MHVLKANLYFRKVEVRNMVNFGQMAILTINETKSVHEVMVRKAIRKIKKEK